MSFSCGSRKLKPPGERRLVLDTAPLLWIREATGQTDPGDLGPSVEGKWQGHTWEAFWWLLWDMHPVTNVSATFQSVNKNVCSEEHDY